MALPAMLQEWHMGRASWAQGALPVKCLIPSSPVGKSLAVSKSVPALVSDASIKLAE